MTAEHLGRGYAPLPQSISNTDTEDDEEHDNLRVPQRMSNLYKYSDRSPQNNGMTASNIVTKNGRNGGRFYPLDETQNMANRLKNERNALNYCNDEIPIMIIEGDGSNDLWKRQDMSPMRRLCLIVSILVCVLTILIFLYALPCDDSVICPETVKPRSLLSWDRSLEGVEINGPISIVSGTPNNLIFLLRGQQFGINDKDKSSSKESIPSDGGGVISVQGNSGIPLWWVILKRIPKDINCVVLDTDGSGKPDCLVSGEKGLLASIEPTSGVMHWNSLLHTHEKLPVLLPDVNNDGIGDLLTVELNDQEKSQSNNLVILSGKNGILLARQRTACSSIELTDLDFNMTVSYICHEEDREITELIPLHELINAVNLSRSAPKHKLFLNSQINTYNLTLSPQSMKNNWEITPQYHLSVQNLGICPSETCKVVMNLTLRNFNNETSSVWDQVSLKSFASKPAILNATNVVGFAIKIWEWADMNSTPVTDDFVRRSWTERVILVYMNSTEVRQINASQSEVLQLCKNDNCQPNLELQSHSIAIADLNNDGLLDLINYRTSYNLNHTNWLSSKVQIVKLDSFL